MRKRDRKNIKKVLVLVPILLAFGCTEESTQRDVYTRFEDCVVDWGKPELCQEIAKAEAQQYANSVGANTGGTSPVIFWGPTYYPGNRAVEYNGQTYTPGANHAMSRPFSVHSSSSKISKSSPASPRGGFGSRGRFAGGGRGGGT